VSNSKYTLNKLLQGKMFLGGVRSKWNPEIVAYLSGSRHHIYILDVIASSFRLKKFLSFSELAARRRGRPVFILIPSFQALRHSIHPSAYYVSEYKGGVVSNFRSLLHTYNSGIFSLSKPPMFPFGVIAFNDYTQRVSYIANEASRTRTPCALLADSGHSPFNVSYSILSSSDYNVAHLMTNAVLASIRRGKRQERLSLRNLFQSLIKKTVKLRCVKIEQTLPLISKFRNSSLFYDNIRQRKVFVNFFARHCLKKLLPKEDNFYKYSFNRRSQTQPYITSFNLLKHVSNIRVLLSSLYLLTKIFNYKYIKQIFLCRGRKFFTYSFLRRHKYKQRWRKFNLRWKLYKRQRPKKSIRFKLNFMSRILIKDYKFPSLTLRHLFINAKNLRTLLINKYSNILSKSKPKFKAKVKPSINIKVKTNFKNLKKR
jgi:hypothetical protein